jgi:hypothetical protein
MACYGSRRNASSSSSRSSTAAGAGMPPRPFKEQSVLLDEARTVPVLRGKYGAACVVLLAAAATTLLLGVGGRWGPPRPLVLPYPPRGRKGL